MWREVGTKRQKQPDKNKKQIHNSFLNSCILLSWQSKSKIIHEVHRTIGYFIDKDATIRNAYYLTSFNRSSCFHHCYFLPSELIRDASLQVSPFYSGSHQLLYVFITWKMASPFCKIRIRVVETVRVIVRRTSRTF